MKMKSIKQIRKDNDESSKEKSMISSLCENGLLDADKAIFFERALNKDVEKLTISERKILKSVVESLMIENHSRLNSVDTEQLDESIKRDVKDYLAKYDPTVGGNKFPTDKDMPQVLILKRKAIRIYPDNQKVALYYSDALNKYVTIPFGAIGINERYEAIANRAEKELAPKKIRGREVRGDMSRFVAKNIPVGREKDPALLDAMEKKLGYRPDLAGAQNANIDKTNLPFFSKLGLKHGAAVRRFVLSKKKRSSTPSENKGTESPSVTPAPEPVPTPTLDKKGRKLNNRQKSVLADLNKRQPTIQSFKQKAKDISLSDEERSKAATSARKWSSQRLSDKKKVGLRESFVEKLEEKRNINEFLGRLVGTAARTGAGKNAIEKGTELLSDFFKRAAKNKKPDAKPADRVPDTGPEAPKPKTEPKPSDKPEPVPARKPDSKPTGRPTRGLRRLFGRLPGGNDSGGNNDGPGSQAQYSKISEPVKAPEFRNEPVSKSRATRFDPEYSVNIKQTRAVQQNPFGTQQQNVVKELYDIKGKTELNINGNSVVVNEVIAEKLIKLHESLSQENKFKMESMLNEDVDSFRKVLEFAVGQK